MPDRVKGDLLSQDIKNIYIDVICLYAADKDGNKLYFETSDTEVNPEKDYFRYVDGQYVWVQPTTASTEGLYEEKSIYLNSSHNFVYNNRHYKLAAFEVVEPDRTSVNEEQGTLNIGGVTGEYIDMLQEVQDKLMLSCGMLRASLNSSGTYVVESDYVLDPIEYEVANFTIASADSAISLSLQGGGILNYNASKDVFGTSNFPGLH